MTHGPGILFASNCETSDKLKRVNRFAAISKLTLAVAVSLTILLSSCQKSSSGTAALAEDLGYASQVSLSDMHLSAEENFLGQQVVYLDGTIKNQGPRVVHRVKVRLFFRDTLNQVILREEREILAAPAKTLRPGQSRSFQIRFDEAPDSWNRQPPQLQLVSLQTGRP